MDSTTKKVTKEISFLAWNIKVLRKEKGLTQAKFAKILGISRPVMGAYEEGRCVPPITTLCKIMDFFQVSFEQIYKGDLHFLHSGIGGVLIRKGYSRSLNGSELLIDTETDEMISVKFKNWEESWKYYCKNLKITIEVLPEPSE